MFGRFRKDKRITDLARETQAELAALTEADKAPLREALNPPRPRGGLALARRERAPSTRATDELDTVPRTAEDTMIVSSPVMLGWLPGVNALVRPVTNLIVSNLAGPRDKLYFHGAEMVAWYPVSQVGHGMALNVTVLSYADQLYFGLVACRDSVPSMQRLALHIGEALDELEATFLADRPRRSTKTARGRKTKRRRGSRNTD
jgi:hypothetical protein